MTTNRSSTLRRLATTIALTCAATGVGAAAAHAGPNPADLTHLPDYVNAYTLGKQAYQYGVPLLNMDKTFRQQTSVTVSDGRGNGPVNRFNHLRHLADPLDRTVVAPNADTMYSIAWLDLSRGPVVVKTPQGGDRFRVLPLYTPYQEVFAKIGSSPSALPDGTYAITPPGWHGRLPKGIKRIRSPYDRAWSIVRILVRGKADEAAVNALQDRYSITPLSRWGKKARKPRRGAKRRPADTTLDKATIPGTAKGDDPIAFYDALGDALAQFPPPAEDAPLLERFQAVGIGPGLHPGTSGQSNATLQGLRDALAAGQAEVDTSTKKLYLSSAASHNGWLVTRTGNYGTDYEKRAVVDKVGLGALPSDIAVYPFTQTDQTAQNLTGASRYVAHLSAKDAHPPVEAFWSLTLYDRDMFFVPNPIDRYVLNDGSDLHYNPDGSLDFYFQRNAPSDPEQRKNWLPAPAGEFRVMFRLYQVSEAALPGVLDGTGWKPPVILPCTPGGITAAGWKCAS